MLLLGSNVQHIRKEPIATILTANMALAYIVFFSCN